MIPASTGTRGLGGPRSYRRQSLTRCRQCSRLFKCRSVEDHLVNHPLVADQIKFAARVASEGHDSLWGDSQLADHFQAAVLLREAEEPLRFVIAENVNAVKGRARIGAVNITAGDAGAKLARVGEHGRHEGFTFTAIASGKSFESLKDIPPKILAAPDDVDFFIAVLAHVADPEVAIQGIEAETPRLAQSVSPDFRTEVRAADERVVVRDGVQRVAVATIHINAEHLAKQQPGVLSIAVGILLRPGIAHADVEKSIRSELQPAPVMDVGNFVDFQDDFARLAGIAFQIRSRFTLEDDRGKLAVLDDVSDDKVSAVLAELRMQRHAEQAARASLIPSQFGEQSFRVAVSFFQSPDSAGFMFGDQEH